MLDILAKANLGVLRRFARSRVLLAFDFDGTLSPMVAEPQKARLRPRTAELLMQLCRLYPCAIISGRSIADVRPRVEGIGFHEVIGNHGLERRDCGLEFVSVVTAWRPVLEKRLAPFKGVVVEDKGHSVSVHYRHSTQKVAARRAIAQVAAELHPLRVIGGHQVVNLLPPAAPHKGVALSEARERLGCQTAIYVGDDETDEDVFALDEPARLLGVRVGQRAQSRAGFYLRRHQAIDDFIERLTWLRTDETEREVTDERRHARARAAATTG
ncbi:MAG: trehalose-phosphatase [Archangiaceae bacterium]|nr:trehalose-phosphatase [Archangiaceae bacterium]